MGVKMFCKNCGTELIEGSNICQNCGTSVDNVSPSPEDHTQDTHEPAPKFSGKVIAGLVLSLVGIIVAAIPCGIIGLIFSSLGLKELRLPQYKGNGMAIAGMVISIIDVVLGIIYLAM